MDWKPFLGLLFASLVLGACSGVSESPAGKPDAAESTSPASRSESPLTVADAAGTPRRQATPGLPGVDRMQRADSWQERLSVLDPEEGRYLESINGRYFGVLEFRSAEEQRQQLANGYPTAEEWLAARRMSDSELRDIALQGNPKGAVLFANRELDRLAAARDGRTGNDLDASVVQPQGEADWFATQALRRSRSPFAAYLYAGVYRGTRYEREAMAAAILVAAALGDPRAGELAERVAREGPLDFPTVVMMQKMIWNEVGVAPR